MSLKAAVSQGPSTGLVIGDRPIPRPGRREIIVKVDRCGICGTDIHFTNGQDFLQAPVGAIPGHEYAGEVVEIGSDVSRIAIEDRITALAAIAACGRCDRCVDGDLQWCIGDDKLYPASGVYTQFAPVTEAQAVKLPMQLSAADAALVEPLAVGLHSVVLAGLEPDADVLILGAGPIGLAVAVWARQFGVERIVVQARSRRREPWARALGATDFITCGDNPVAAALESLDARPAWCSRPPRFRAQLSKQCRSCDHEGPWSCSDGAACPTRTFRLCI